MVHIILVSIINRNYVQSTKKQQNWLKKNVLRKIYPKKADYNCILLILGSALSGESVKDMETLFLLGQGSSGKSFLLSLTGASIGCYFKELKNNTFSVGSSEQSKIINYIHYRTPNSYFMV